MTGVRLAGVWLLVLASGCACTQPSKGAPPAVAVIEEQPSAARQPEQQPKRKVAPTPTPPELAPTAAPAVSAPAEPRPVPPSVVAPVVAAAPEPAPVVKAEAPAPRPEVPAPKPASPAAKSQAPAVKPVPAPAPKLAAPALDMALLEKRLKDTPAIGVFTKLTLKNQVDDLLDQFRAFYQGRSKTTLAALRQPYDLLILKVLTLLQDGDPVLARAVADSRETIWGILADPVKFKNL